MLLSLDKKHTLARNCLNVRRLTMLTRRCGLHGRQYLCVVFWSVYDMFGEPRRSSKRIVASDIRHRSRLYPQRLRKGIVFSRCSIRLYQSCIRRRSQRSWINAVLRCGTIRQLCSWMVDHFTVLILSSDSQSWVSFFPLPINRSDGNIARML